MSRTGSLASRLYRGEVSYDFVGRRKTWYILSGVLVVISLLSLIFRGIHPSIEFKGGAVFSAPAHGHSVSDARGVFTAAGVPPEVAQKVGEGQIRIQTAAIDPADPTKTTRLQQALATRLGVARDDVAVSQVGPSWGSQITRKAIQGLVIFLVLLFIVLSVRFEMKMALAAFIALIHDIVITAGVYSLVGFEVSPGTVIALLTILGYSLYDTVVVFDKVRENTAGLAGGSRMTFSQAANLALNQTLVRSINTSIIGLLPVASLLFIGAGLLKAGTLKDLALALFIGLMCGAYSSIFTATPLLCDMKEREPAMRALARRVESRQRSERHAVSAGALVGGASTGSVSVAAVDDEDVADDLDSPAAEGGAEPGSAAARTAAAGRSAGPARAARKPARRGGRSGRPSGKRRR